MSGSESTKEAIKRAVVGCVVLTLTPVNTSGNDIGMETDRNASGPISVSPKT